MQSFKILVVDDLPEFRRFICSALQPRIEFQVTEASDGLEAVQKASVLQPDLIVLDISLPKLHGLEVARRVRSLAPAAKILFCSVESDIDLVREALSLGAGYIHKPRLGNDLLPAVETVLEGKQFVSSGLESSENTEARARQRHEILFCRDDEAALEGLTQFIAAALNAGNPAIVWATESHRNTLHQRLHALGLDMDAAIQRGTYISSDVAEPPDLVQMLGAVRSLSAAAFKAGKKHPRVAVCGERAGLLWAEGKADEAIQIEQFCNILAKTYEVDILCVYPFPQGQEEHPAFKTICAEHSAVTF